MAYSDGNSYNEILERCLSNERLAKIDKRQGSVIYDTLAPLCFELAEAYIRMDIMEDQSYLLTATGSNLDKKVYDYGIIRESATKAERIGIFKQNLVNNQNEYVYAYEYVGSNLGNYVVVDGQYEFVGKNNGRFLYSQHVYNYVGSGVGDYTVSAIHVGANKGNYLYNPNGGEPVYIYVGDNNGNYTITATYVGDNSGNYVYESNDYGLIGEGRGDYNVAYQEVGDNQGAYVRTDKMLVDLDVPIGSRFSVPNNSNLIFQFKEVRTLFNGKQAPLDAYEEYNILECESAGTGGNTYIGTILPLTPTIGLVSAELDSEIVTTARDEETDDELRERTQKYLNNVAFGGNIADYLNEVEKQDGTGGVKVFPAYINENQAVIRVIAEDEHPIPLAQLTNIIDIIKLHSQYKYVGEDQGEYSFANNEYSDVGEGNGDYDLITSAYPITYGKKLEFDGSVMISVVDDNFDPLSAGAITNLQNKIDPPDNSGEGYGIAPIGHYVTITTPTEANVNVVLTASFKTGSDVDEEKVKIANSVSKYFTSVRKEFGQDSILEIVVAFISRNILNDCPNVTNITQLKIYDMREAVPTPETDKITYNDTAYVQYIPKLGTLTINTAS